MKTDRININGDYLIIAPTTSCVGNHQMLSERAYLADNIINFLENYPDVKTHAISIYELCEINEDSDE